MKNIVDKETQKSLEIIHLREIIMDLMDAVEVQVLSNTMNRDEMFSAIRKARNSIQ